MKKLPVMLTTLTVVSGIGTQALAPNVWAEGETSLYLQTDNMGSFEEEMTTMLGAGVLKVMDEEELDEADEPAEGVKIYSAEDVVELSDAANFRFTSVDYWNGTLGIEFNPQNDDKLTLKKVVVTGYRYDTHRILGAKGLMYNLGETAGQPEWTRWISTWSFDEPAGRVKESYEVESDFAGPTMKDDVSGILFYAVAYTDASGDETEMKWIRGVLDYRDCAFAGDGANRQYAVCKVRRGGAQGGDWEMWREDSSFAEVSTPWRIEMASIIDDKITEVESEIKKYEGKIPADVYDRIETRLWVLYDVAYDTDETTQPGLLEHQGRALELLGAHGKAEKVEENEGNEGGGQGSGGGNDEEGGGSEEDSDGDDDEGGSGEGSGVGGNGSGADSGASGTGQTMVTPDYSHGSISGGQGGLGAGADEDNVVIKPAEQVVAMSNGPSISPVMQNAVVPVHVVQIVADEDKQVAAPNKNEESANDGENGEAGDVGETGDSGDGDEVQENEKEVAAVDNLGMTVPALNEDQQSQAESAKKSGAWWLIVPVVALVGTVVAWWSKRAFGSSKR